MEPVKSDGLHLCLVPADAPGAIVFEASGSALMDGVDGRIRILTKLRGIQVGRYVVCGSTHSVAAIANLTGERIPVGVWGVYHIASGNRVYSPDDYEHAMVVADTMSTYGPDVEETDGIEAMEHFMRDSPPGLNRWLKSGAPGDYRQWLRAQAQEELDRG